MRDNLLTEQDETELDAIWEEICQMDEAQVDEFLCQCGYDPEEIRRRIRTMVDTLLAEIETGTL